jgi:hypothetical protein
MLNSNTKRRMLFLVFIMLSGFFAARAQAPRYLYVSADKGGSDLNDCTRLAPCREFARPLSLVYDNGIIVVLSSGEYNGFTITKPVKIIAESGIIPIIKNGRVTIATTSESYSIWIRGLYMAQGLNVAYPVGYLSVEDSTIVGGEGALQIYAPGNYVFKNTRMRTYSGENQGSAAAYINPSYTDPSDISVAKVLFDDCIFEDALTGLSILNHSNVTIRNSLVANNTYGIDIVGSSPRVFIENSQITNNSTYGIQAAGGFLQISNSSITGSGTYGIYATGGFVQISNTSITSSGSYGIFKSSGATVRSFGNNVFANNINGSMNGTITVIPLQ